MLILGIETSFDETAASVLAGDNKKFNIELKSSVIFSQSKMHDKTGGAVPEVAAREHVLKIIPVINEALIKANVKLAEIDVIAVTAGPGLMTSLMVGVDTARALALALNKPLVAVNHMEAHVFSPFIEPTTYQLPASPARYAEAQARRAGRQATSSLFPALCLVVSGGHTELILVSDWLKYKKIGATVDDAAGEAFDKTAKLLGLPYPGGPELSRLAEKGKPIIDFPRPMIDSDDFNFSFSGLKTAVLYYLRDHPLQATSYDLQANLASSIQQAIVDVLVSKTEKAARKFKVKTIMLAGGVAANQLLRSRLQTTSHDLQAKFLAARPEFCTDNAAMIAFAGYLHARKKQFTPIKKVKADSSWELD